MGELGVVQTIFLSSIFFGVKACVGMVVVVMLVDVGFGVDRGRWFIDVWVLVVDVCATLVSLASRLRFCIVRL